MHNQIDPYTPAEPVYECVECGARNEGGPAGRCSECDAPRKNLTVPRE